MKMQKLILAVTLALVAPLGTAYADKHEGDRDRDRMMDQDQDRDRMMDQDRDRMMDREHMQDKDIYGWKLMTTEEREAYRERMRAAKTMEEREQIRKEHHEEMKKRAKEKGVTLPDEPPPRGMGKGMGPGGGMGGGMGGTGGSTGGGKSE